jgi:hypothetical protein
MGKSRQNVGKVPRWKKKNKAGSSPGNFHRIPAASDRQWPFFCWTRSHTSLADFLMCRPRPCLAEIGLELAASVARPGQNSSSPEPHPPPPADPSTTIPHRSLPLIWPWATAVPSTTKARRLPELARCSLGSSTATMTALGGALVGWGEARWRLRVPRWEGIERLTGEEEREGKRRERKKEYPLTSGSHMWYKLWVTGFG